MNSLVVKGVEADNTFKIQYICDILDYVKLTVEKAVYSNLLSGLDQIQEDLKAIRTNFNFDFDFAFMSSSAFTTELRKFNVSK